MFSLFLTYIGVMIGGTIFVSLLVLATAGTVTLFGKLGLNDTLSGFVAVLLVMILLAFGFAYLDQHIKDKQNEIINSKDKIK